MKKRHFLFGAITTLSLLASPYASAAITSPMPNSTITSDTVSFEWDPVPNATKLLITIHKSPKMENGTKVYSSGHLQGIDTSLEVTDLPANADKFYLRFHQEVDGQWTYKDYIYSVDMLDSQVPNLISPPPGSILSSTSQTFTWEESNARRINIKFGKGPVVGNEIASYGQFDIFSGNSVTVNNLPNDGSAIFVSFSIYIDGVWLNKRYQYTSAY